MANQLLMIDDNIDRRYSPVHTLIHGDKEAPLKEFSVWSDLRHGKWIEQKFEAVLGFDEALKLFFTKGFVEHFYDEIGKIPKNKARDYTNEWRVLCKIYEDFESGFHRKEFKIVGNGVTLRADSVMPVATFFPLNSADLVIKGNIQF